MNPILGDPKAGVYIALGAVFVGIVFAFLLLSWRDSVRALREFFALPKRLRRPQFSLAAILLATAACAVFLKVGMACQWCPNWPWLFVVPALLLAIGLLVQSYLWTNERRPEVKNARPIGPPPDDQLRAVDAQKKHTERIKLQVKKRRIIPFRW